MKTLSFVIITLLLVNITVAQQATKKDSLIDRKVVVAGKYIKSAVKKQAFSIGLSVVGGTMIGFSPLVRQEERFVLIGMGSAFMAFSIGNLIGSMCDMNKAGKIMMMPTGVIIKF